MGVLDGVRVVEIGVWVAGPAVGGVMADWGADVVKVEPPVGDPFRQLFASIGLDPSLPNAPFALDNRGKRSVVLDLRADGASDALHALLDAADVFVTNLRPDALDRMALDPESVTARHERLVYASVSGYGLRGPERDRAAYDVGAFWARPGIASSLVPRDQAPPGIRGGLGDHTTGLATVAGILAALLERTRTGRGKVVETSLMRTGMYCLGWDLGIQLQMGKLASTQPRTTSPTPLVNSYRAMDDRWFFLLGLEADRHWPGVCRAVAEVDLAADPRFASAASRFEHRGELIAALDEAFARLPLSSWSERFDANDVWWAPSQHAADVVADPQAHAAGAFVEIEADVPLTAIASPVRFHGDEVERTGPVPRLGEHTVEVLTEAGLTDADLARLRASGAITA